MPKMDSIEHDRPQLKKVQGPEQPQIAINNHEEGHKKEGQPEDGLFEQSPSSTVKDLQRKLDQIQSPSDSKVSDSQDQSMTDNFTETSIPQAHREYEKILRQLEAECRNHIRCE